MKKKKFCVATHLRSLRQVDAWGSLSNQTRLTDEFQGKKSSMEYYTCLGRFKPVPANVIFLFVCFL